MFVALPDLPLLALYAETHFRFFPGFPSLLYRRRPEIVFDMPRRLAPGHDLPVVLVLNDIDRFPVVVENISLTLSHGIGQTELIDFGVGEDYRLAHPLSARCAVYLLRVPRSKLSGAVVHVNGRVRVAVGTRREFVLNDNFPGTSHLCMSAVVSDTPLPGQDVCAYGDLHVHSQYSESHVEFGLPIEAIRVLAQAAGLDFVAITDHSYDLATRIDDYLEPDPQLGRWTALGADLERLKPGLVVARGEEISALNSHGQVVHLGAIGLSELVRGTLDGARKGRGREMQHSVAEASRLVHDQGGIVFAAHPGAAFGLLQSLLLRRGAWAQGDVSSSELDGFQGVNGSFGEQWQRAKRLWVKALLSGRRLPLLAGSDAHGDFNRYRCIQTPFLSIAELHERYLGFTRTGLYAAVASQDDLVRAVAAGETFVTSGPFMALAADSQGQTPIVGSRGRRLDECGKTWVVVRSTPEFGPVVQTTVYRGQVGERRERVVLRSYAGGYETAVVLPSGLAQSRAWFRAECTTRDTNGLVRHAATSPVYVNA